MISHYLIPTSVSENSRYFYISASWWNSPNTFIPDAVLIRHLHVKLWRNPTKRELDNQTLVLLTLEAKPSLTVRVHPCCWPLMEEPWCFDRFPLCPGARETIPQVGVWRQPHSVDMSRSAIGTTLQLTCNHRRHHPLSPTEEMAPNFSKVTSKLGSDMTYYCPGLPCWDGSGHKT